MLSPDEFHTRRHKLKGGRLPKPEECRRCAVAKAKCAAKQIFKTRPEADKKVLEVNIERHWWPGACEIAYLCRYCKNYHITTATRNDQLRKVDRMYKDWLRKTGQKLKRVDQLDESRLRFPYKEEEEEGSDGINAADHSDDVWDDLTG